jgi:hypothetical protein
MSGSRLEFSASAEGWGVVMVFVAGLMVGLFAGAAFL